MENRLNDIDELIGKYLAGEASEQEARQVELWSAASAENRKYVDHFRLIFDRAASIKETIDVDTDAAWTKLKSRMKPQAKVVMMQPEPSGNLFWKIAAAVLVIAMAGVIGYRLSLKPAGPIQVVAESTTVSDTLPGGSNVVLNKKTQLSYSFEKSKKEHKVKLHGEAYFDVHHQQGEKFIVEIDDIFIRDIGTSFNVRAYPESNTIEVMVDEGEIRFYTNADTGITLKAGGKGVYDKTTKSFNIERPDPNASAYKSRIFVFSNTNLGAAIDQINSVYDKKIIISDSLRKSNSLNVTFKQETIESIAGVIGDTFCLTVTKTEKGFELSGKGCAEEK